MTFATALDDYDARINLLGGLAAIYPFIPYPIDIVKQRITRGDYFSDDKESASVWLEATGLSDNFHADTAMREITANKGFAALCRAKGITETSPCELVGILKEAAYNIAAMTNSEFETLMKKIETDKMDNYTVEINVRGTITINVLATSFDDAEQSALKQFEEMDLDPIEYADHSIKSTTNSNGESQFHK